MLIPVIHIPDTHVNTNSIASTKSNALTMSKGATVQAMKKPAPKAEQNCVGMPAEIGAMGV